MSLVDTSNGVCMVGWLVGWVCVGACAGAGGRKNMSSARIYFGLLNCGHSVYKVIS